MDRQAERGEPPRDRIIGAILVAAAVMTVLAMAHHPTSADGGGIGDYVHGAMLLLLAALFFGFAHVALRRGIERPLILAGLVAYGISLAVHLGAATINGFVVPALVARGPEAVDHDIFVLCWEANQALARLGVFATGAAYVFWALDFITRAGVLNRITGIAGLAAGLIPMWLLVSGALEMNVAGAFAIYAMHAGWALLVGVCLMRGKI